MKLPGISKGVTVALAGTGINLALGVLYTWSIFKGAIRQSLQEGGPGSFRWDPASLNDPYAVCCIVFAGMMIVAGRIQDRFGPRLTAFVGGVLVGTGFLWVAQTTSYLSWILGFGVLAGTGIAFGYSAATPAALKWFHPSRTGRISGLVVAGFGLASVYIAPLAQFLLRTRGIEGAMQFFGIAFFLVVGLLSMFLVNPPEGYVPLAAGDRRASIREPEMKAKFRDVDALPTQVVKTPFFWLLWLLYFIGAGAGLMVIGSVAGMAKASLGKNAFAAVAILAVGNAGGRIATGMLSDAIGRKRTLLAIFAAQALLMFIAIPVISSAANPLQLLLLASLIGFNYGANLALFPSYCKDLWGMKHFGVNYGLLFTAWGCGGLVMGRVSESLLARTGGFTGSFVIAGTLLLIGTALVGFLRDRKEEMRREVRLLAGDAHQART
jgi:MFS family permease